jgi:hypothetical protein
LAMKLLASFCCHARILTTAMICLVCACEARAADMYNGTDLLISSVTIGDATYSAMVVTLGAIVSVQWRPGFLCSCHESANDPLRGLRGEYL